MATDEFLRLRKAGRCGLITLDRPAALNALTLPMLEAIGAHYRAWAADPDIYGVVIESTDSRAFCSGGDLKTLYAQWRHGDHDTVLRFYEVEYRRALSLDRFSKPSIALLDGVVMGGGVGISLYGTHRVAGDTVRLAMPEVGIGFFPDVGGTWFLSRLPHAIGAYLALTGREVGSADAYWLGLVSHCVPSANFAEIREAMIDSEPIDTILKALHSVPAAGPIEALAPRIEAVFSASTVEEILQRLDDEGDVDGWAAETASAIRGKSPTSLKIALRQMQIGRRLDLAEALELELRLVRSVLGNGDFLEGIRATLIDKDKAPRWKPKRLEQIPETMLDARFAPRPSEPALLAGDAKKRV